MDIDAVIVVGDFIGASVMSVNDDGDKDGGRVGSSVEVVIVDVDSVIVVGDFVINASVDGVNVNVNGGRDGRSVGSSV